MHAAQHSQRKADKWSKGEVVKVAKIVGSASRDPESGIHLGLADAAANARSKPVRLSSALAAYARWTRADDKLSPYIAEKAKTDFIAFISAFEAKFGVSLNKNQRSFPLGPFKEDEDEDGILRLCGRALLCFEEE